MNEKLSHDECVERYARGIDRLRYGPSHYEIKCATCGVCRPITRLECPNRCKKIPAVPEVKLGQEWVTRVTSENEPEVSNNLNYGTCKECGCTTGGAEYCFEHKPYTVTPLKDGSYRVNRHGVTRVSFDAPPTPESENALLASVEKELADYTSNTGNIHPSGYKLAEFASELRRRIAAVSGHEGWHPSHRPVHSPPDRKLQCVECFAHEDDPASIIRACITTP